MSISTQGGNSINFDDPDVILHHDDEAEERREEQERDKEVSNSIILFILLNGECLTRPSMCGEKVSIFLVYCIYYSIISVREYF